MEKGEVVITGATGQVGRATIRALVRNGHRPTALVRKEVLIEGCTTIPDWLTSERALTAIQNAKIVVHLAGNLNPADRDYENANIVPTQRIADAVIPDRNHRLIFLSYVGAAEQSTNLYLATKARAERLLQETGVRVTVFRCTHIIGPPQHPGPTAATLMAGDRRSVKVLGNGKQRLAPVFLGDVVAAIQAAIGLGHTGTFDLQGPDEMSLDDLVRLLDGTPDVFISHVPVLLAHLLRFVGPRLPGALIDVMLSDSISSNATAAATFGISLTHLDCVWSKPNRHVPGR